MVSEWGLTGACPGTALVQATAGIGHSRFVTMSSVLAGVAFARWKESWTQNLTAQQGVTSESVMSVTGWSAKKAALVYNSMILVLIATVLSLAPRSTVIIHPIPGGLLVGLSQIASLALAQKAFGVSTAYKATGNAVLSLLRGRPVKGLDDSVIFAGALVVGAKLTMLSLPGVMKNLVPLKGRSILVRAAYRQTDSQAVR